MDPKIYCEPNCDLPQKFSIEDLKTEEAIRKRKNGQASEESENSVQCPKVNVEASYEILPRVDAETHILEEVLSLKKNEYLRLKWNEFLDDPSGTAKKWVRIQLYTDLHKPPMPEPRNKTLNGGFYIDNKLAPVPFASAWR